MEGAKTTHRGVCFPSPKARGVRAKIIMAFTMPVQEFWFKYHKNSDDKEMETANEGVNNSHAGSLTWGVYKNDEASELANKRII